MAKYNVSCACGRETRVDISGPVKNREWKAEHYNYVCDECKAKAHAEATAKAAAQAKEQGLPLLQGSEKQVAWAETIRVALIERAEKHIKTNPMTDAKIKEGFAALKVKMTREQAFEALSDDRLVLERCECEIALEEMKKATSAKAFIDFSTRQYDEEQIAMYLLEDRSVFEPVMDKKINAICDMLFATTAKVEVEVVTVEADAKSCVAEVENVEVAKVEIIEVAEVKSAKVDKSVLMKRAWRLWREADNVKAFTGLDTFSKCLKRAWQIEREIANAKCACGNKREPGLLSCKQCYDAKFTKCIYCNREITREEYNSNNCYCYACKMPNLR